MNKDMRFESWDIEDEIRNDLCIPLIFSDLSGWRVHPLTTKASKVLIFKINHLYRGQCDDKISTIFESLSLMFHKHIKIVKMKVYNLHYVNEPKPDSPNIPDENLYMEALKEKIKNKCLEKGVDFEFLDRYTLDQQQYDTEPIKHFIGDHHSPIPAVDHIVWSPPTISTPIPNGIKRITLIYVNCPIKPGILPDSLHTLILREFNQDLSLISFPKKLRCLALDKFTLNIYGNLDIPISLTYLSISVRRMDDSHWLYQRGSLPRNVTRLRLVFCQPLPPKPIVLPSGLENIDICGTQLPHGYTIVDRLEYYRYQVIKYSPNIPKLKHLKLNYSFKQHLTPEALPSCLESLDISASPNHILHLANLPNSLTYLKTKTCFPSNMKLNYLEYWLEPLACQIIMGDHNRSITKDSLLYGTRNDHVLTLETNSKLPIDLISIGDVYQDKKIYLPNVPIKHLKSSLLPSNYPEGLESITINRPFTVDPSLIAPTVKNLEIKIEDGEDLSKYSDLNAIQEFLISKYDKSKNFTQNQNTTTNESFLIIWRNLFLKKKILSNYYPTIMAVKVSGNNNVFNRFKNLNLLLPSSFEVLDLPNQVEGLRQKSKKLYYKGNVKRLDINDLPQIPHGVTHLKLRKRITAGKNLQKQIPKSVTWLYLSEVNGLNRNKIPPSVTHLVISTTNINPDSIPPTVEILEFKSIRAPIDHLGDVIPLTVKRVILSLGYFLYYSIPSFLIQRNLLDQEYAFYQPDAPISPSATVLIWGKNEIIPKGVIPSHIKTLIFGNRFNQTILKDTLPLSITQIVFGTAFSQNISNIYLPNNLKYIVFKGSYPHPIVANSFPPFLSHLSFSHSNHFKYPASLVNLPPSISHLEISLNNVNELSKLLRFVKHLKVKSDQDSIIIGSSIESIQTNAIVDLDLNQKEEQEPKEKVNYSFPKTCFLDLKIASTIIPGTISHLNVKTLRFNFYFNEAIFPDTIPNTVERMYFFEKFNQQHFHLPPFLKILDLGNHFNQPIHKDTFPETLEELKFSECFDQPIEPRVLPNNLTKLIFGYSFNQPLEPGAIPEGLKRLEFGTTFKQEKYSVPSGLKILKFGRSVENFPTPLPLLLEEISLGQGFANLDLKEILLQMSNLHTLELNSTIDQTFLHSSPPSLKVLILNGDTTLSYQTHGSDTIEASAFPKSLTKLHMNDSKLNLSNIDLLPPSVKTLILGTPYFTGTLPPTIEALEFSGHCHFNRPLQSLY